VLLEYFIGKISDEAERDRSWERKRVIARFVDSKNCRHRQICAHFGETTKWERCGSCDNCGAVPEWLSSAKELAPVAAPAPRRKISVRKPAADTEDLWPGATTAAEYDPGLAENLREWRRNLAREQKIPA
jgi:superfamily II DNA helicase RecQ